MVAKKVRNVGIIVVRGRERKLYEGSKGGIFYRSKGSKVYVDKKALRQSSQKKKKVVAKKKNKFGAGEWHDFSHHWDNLGKQWNNAWNNHDAHTTHALTGANEGGSPRGGSPHGTTHLHTANEGGLPVKNARDYYARVGRSMKGR